MRYDLVVIGSGPAGQKGAIAASKMNKKVAIVERTSAQMGGVCLHTGTIPSKTMREAILHLSGYRQREVYGDQYRKKRHITMDSLRRKIAHVTQLELDVVHDQLERNQIDIFSGEARFLGPHEVEVVQPNGSTVLETDHALPAADGGGAAEIRASPARAGHVAARVGPGFAAGVRRVLDPR